MASSYFLKAKCSRPYHHLQNVSNSNNGCICLGYLGIKKIGVFIFQHLSLLPEEKEQLALE
jgi:hypothetical protein